MYLNFILKTKLIGYRTFVGWPIFTYSPSENNQRSNEGHKGLQAQFNSSGKKLWTQSCLKPITPRIKSIKKYLQSHFIFISKSS